MADEKPVQQQDEINSDLIVSAVQFFQKVYQEKEVIIKFQKKDKTMRIMHCTLNFQRIPVDKKPKGVNVMQILKLIQKNKIMHVFDLEKNEWRSVPFDSVEYLETREKRYYIKKEKK